MLWIFKKIPLSSVHLSYPFYLFSVTPEYQFVHNDPKFICRFPDNACREKNIILYLPKQSKIIERNPVLLKASPGCRHVAQFREKVSPGKAPCSLPIHNTTSPGLKLGMIKGKSD